MGWHARGSSSSGCGGGGVRQEHGGLGRKVEAEVRGLGADHVPCMVRDANTLSRLKALLLLLLQLLLLELMLLLLELLLVLVLVLQLLLLELKESILSLSLLLRCIECRLWLMWWREMMHLSLTHSINHSQHSTIDNPNNAPHHHNQQQRSSNMPTEWMLLLLRLWRRGEERREEEARQHRHHHSVNQPRAPFEDFAIVRSFLSAVACLPPIVRTHNPISIVHSSRTYTRESEPP